MLGVLCVDDSDFKIGSLARLARTRGVAITRTDSREEALRIAGDRAVDVVATHVSLRVREGDATGFEVAAEISRSASDVGVVLFSSMDEGRLTDLAERIPRAWPMPWSLSAARMCVVFRNAAGCGVPEEILPELDEARRDNGDIAFVRAARAARARDALAACADWLDVEHEWFRVRSVVGVRWSDDELRSLLVERRTRSGRRLSLGHLVVISSVTRCTTRAALVELCLAKDLTVRELEQLVSWCKLAGRATPDR